MRHTFLAALVMAAAIPAALAAQTRQASPPSHPPEVAFVDEGSLGSVYRRTEGSLRLYTYDDDPVGASHCNDGCASAWPPLYAPADAVAVGDWTVVTRADHKRQWAYRGKPVYTRFHDSPDSPTGDGIPQWRMIRHVPTPPAP